MSQFDNHRDDYEPSIDEPIRALRGLERVRILVVVNWDPEENDCEIESLSSHRSCSHRLGCDATEGGPTGALRALADEIDRAEDRWRGIPDG